MTALVALGRRTPPVLLAGCTALVVWTLAAGHLVSPLKATAVLLAALAAVVALRHPQAMLGLGFAATALIPVYWVPSPSGIPVAPVMGTVVAVVLLPAVAVAHRGRRWVPIDIAALAFVGLVVVAAYADSGSATSFSAQLVATALLPYLAARLLADENGRRWIAGATVPVATLLSVVGIREHAGAANPFFTLVKPKYLGSLWARPELRLDSVRAEASFGHPIAFGMFLALSIALTLWLARDVQRWWLRLLLLGAAGVQLVALSDTLTRGPYLALVLAVVLALPTALRGRRWVRTAFGVAALAAIVALTPVASTVSTLWERSSGTTSEANSARYRLELASTMTDGANFSWFGKPASDAEGGIAGSARQRIGVVSIDDEYTLVYLQSGLLALLAFVGVSLCVWWAALRRRLSLGSRVWGLAALGATVAITTVALFTQYVEIFWMLIGVTAAIDEQRRTRRLAGGGTSS
jgi:O-antigen ligase